MRDVLSRKSFERYLSQLQKVSKRPFFIKSGVYSCLAFFSVSVGAVSPTLQKQAVLGEAETASVVASVQPDEQLKERCYWQNDVAKFLASQKGELSQSTVPCEQAPRENDAVVSDVSLSVSESELGKTLREMTAGYPIEEMAPFIATFDRGVAGLIVGIAKKESNWGKRVPLDKNGADCFNYWGYKGAGTRGVAMGHGCFGSKEEAVKAIGTRLNELVAQRETSAPKSMIIWKCGSSCKGHSDESVQKWISDVSLYYNRIAMKDK